MELRIHNDINECEKILKKIGGKEVDLTYWNKYTNIIFSDDKCYLHFSKTGEKIGEDLWELHIAFDKSYRGKQANSIIKQGTQWMLDNKTSRVICGIPKENLGVRTMANLVGFKKIGTENNNECYEIRRELCQVQ